MIKTSPLKSVDYLKNSDLFFDSSKLLFSQITNMFDFAWPMVAGMWNLRWQVNGYIYANPASTVDELSEKFTKGSGGDRANLVRACQDFTWDDQKEQFAILLLVNSFAFYESWVSNILKELGYESKELKNLETLMQKWDDKSKTWGLHVVINTVIEPYSDVMHDLFYKHYSSRKKNSLNKLNNLMVCYKCFKELRNCVMHKGSIADSLVLDAYVRYHQLAPSDLNAKELPSLITPVLDNYIKIDLRGVVGFYDIILKIVATVDAELSVSKKAEKITIRKGKKANGRLSLKAEGGRMNAQIRGYFGKIHMPKPADYSKAVNFLKENLLVS